MPRGELWLPEELKVLFNVVQDSCDLDILMSSRHANAVEWEPIALEMVRFGFRRTWQQCRAKWKALRRAFHLENEHKLRYGTHSDKRPASYSIMLKLWQKAGRPVFRDQHMLRRGGTARVHRFRNLVRSTTQHQGLRSRSPRSRRGPKDQSIHFGKRHQPLHHSFGQKYGDRSRHLTMSCDGLGRQAFCRHALSRVRQYLSGNPRGFQQVSSFAPNPQAKVEEVEAEAISLDCDVGIPASHTDSMSVLCAGSEQDVLEEEEDVKPKILHHLPETSRTDTESAADKCQELQLLEKLVMQQKEIITRLDYLNYNLVQMATLHCHHMMESSDDPLKVGRQDAASSGNPSVPITSMFIPFPTSVPPESAYMTYISAPCTLAPLMSCPQSPSSSHHSFHLPATCTSSPYVPSSQPAASYITTSQFLSSLYMPSAKSMSAYLSCPSTMNSDSPSESTGQPSTVSSEKTQSNSTQ